MNRFLVTTAMGLFLGVTPALAQDQAPQDQTTSPPAIQTPASPAEVPSVIDNSMSHGGTLTAIVRGRAPVDHTAGKSALNAAPNAAGSDRFLSAQQSSDYLASNLIGETVVNARNETIGEVNDLVTDKDGKIVAVLVGAGGFLGIGVKGCRGPFRGSEHRA